MRREQWTTRQCAEYVGITIATWRHYYSHQVPPNNPAPMPDGHFDGRTPWWWSTTVRRWHESRPSQRNVTAPSS